MSNLIESEETCPVCRKRIIDNMHCETCCKVRVSMIHRHNAIVNYLLEHLPKLYEAVPVDVKHDSFEPIRVDCK